MEPNQQTPAGEPEFTLPGTPDPFTAGDAVLDRAKSVARRIAEKVRELTKDANTEDTNTDHTNLPGDATEQQPPIP